MLKYKYKILFSLVLLQFMCRAQLNDLVLSNLLEIDTRHGQVSLDSIYESYSNLKRTDPNYLKCLVFRNRYGWAFSKLEELKKDIPAILALKPEPKKFLYKEVFEPNMLPKTEMKRLFQTSKELADYFKNNREVYGEILELKIQLEIYTGNNSEMLIDLPEFLKLLVPGSTEYPKMLWQYGNALRNAQQTDKALSIFEQGVQESPSIQFLLSLVSIYEQQKSTGKIISLEKYIEKDSSGITLFNLAKAFLQEGDHQKAKKYFDAFTTKLVISEVDDDIAYIESGNFIYQYHYQDLEILGDFYLKTKPKQACQYYNVSLRIMNENEFQYPQLMEQSIAEAKDEQEKIKRIYDQAIKELLQSKDKLYEKMTIGCQ